MARAENNLSEKKLCSPPEPAADPDSSHTIHTPVLLKETITYLAPVDGGIYVDGTLGLGGHAEKILQSCGPSGRVIGFEWDEIAIAQAVKRLAPYGQRFTALPRNFAEIRAGLAELNIHRVDGLLLDLGVSSLQFEFEDRGFSFRKDGPLDMRMDQSRHLTAEEIINNFSQEDLADIFFYYGEERQARRIATFITEARNRKRIKSTSELADIITAAVPRKFQPRKIHVATKVFQALRIAVNSELENLTRVMAAIPEILKPHGRVCIISFHSLEDRLVKKKFNQDRNLKTITRKPVTPGKDELQVNPRARSAKLRAAYFEV